MPTAIISLPLWFQTPPGRYLLAWEQAQFDRAVADIFGFNALQLGLPQLDALAANRMPHRWRALPEEALTPTPPPGGLQTQEGGRRVDGADSGHAGVAWGGVADPDGALPQVALVTDAAALPFPEASLDLVALPHTLELSADPHQVLREVERVLRPEGRVVVCGLNPASLWGMRQARARWARGLGISAFGLGHPYLPETGDFIGPWRLRDWLRLMGFEVEHERFGGYRPGVRTDKWLQRWAWMDGAGGRWWPIFGAFYCVVAVKRVRGMRLLGPAWKPRRVPAAAPVSVANRDTV